jgi:hypothetical protein
MEPLIQHKRYCPVLQTRAAIIILGKIIGHLVDVFDSKLDLLFPKETLHNSIEAPSSTSCSTSSCPSESCQKFFVSQR